MEKSHSKCVQGKKGGVRRVEVGHITWQILSCFIHNLNVQILHIHNLNSYKKTYFCEICPFHENNGRFEAIEAMGNTVLPIADRRWLAWLSKPLKQWVIRYYPLPAVASWHGCCWLYLAVKAVMAVMAVMAVARFSSLWQAGRQSIGCRTDGCHNCLMTMQLFVTVSNCHDSS